MLHKNKIGVCLDKHVAYLLEEKNHEKVITIIEADETIKNSALQNKEFIKKVYEVVKDFQKVSLFGPATIKKDFLQRVKAGRLPIEIQNNPIEENLTEAHKFDFINEYFSA